MKTATYEWLFSLEITKTLEYESDWPVFLPIEVVLKVDLHLLRSHGQARQAWLSRAEEGARVELVKLQKSLEPLNARIAREATVQGVRTERSTWSRGRAYLLAFGTRFASARTPC